MLQSFLLSTVIIWFLYVKLSIKSFTYSADLSIFFYKKFNISVRLEQGTVTSLLEEKGTIKGVQYKSKGGDLDLTAHAPLTIVCDGCYSNLRRSLCDPKVKITCQSCKITKTRKNNRLRYTRTFEKQFIFILFLQVDIPSCFVGLVLENCQLPYANHGHVILADPSPILFYPISSAEIRCLVDVPGQKVPCISGGEMAHYLKTKVAPQVCILCFTVCFGIKLFGPHLLTILQGDQ